MSLPIFRQRNQSIKAEFNLLLRSQMPTMLIYAKIAAEYGISEDRVRKNTLTVIIPGYAGVPSDYRRRDACVPSGHWLELG